MWVEAPVFEGDVLVRKLPTVVSDVIPAAGGRLLLLNLRGLNRLAVLDVERAKVTGYVSLDEWQDAFLAAGADDLVALARDGSKIRRWSLSTLQPDLTVALDSAQNVCAIGMGCASAGPLLIVSKKEPVDIDGRFLNLQTLGPLGPETRGQKLGSGHPPTFVAASSDGSKFDAYGRFGSYGVCQIGGAPRCLGDMPVLGMGAVILDTTGSRYFTSSGIAAADGRLIQEPRRGTKAMFVPAYSGAAVAGILPVEKRSGGYDVSEIEIYDGTAEWHLLATCEAPTELRDLRQRPRDTHTVQLQQRVHLYPSADLLVTLGASDDEVTFRRLGIQKALEKADYDFLFVNSLPPPTAERGKLWAYEPKIQAKAPDIKITLDVAPAGMRQSKPGRIEWQVPADQNEAARIVLRFTSSAGLEQFQSFVIQLKASRP